MSAFVEYLELWQGTRPCWVRIKVVDVVWFQFQRQPRYTTAQEALDDFLAVHWGVIIEEPRQ